MRALLPLLMPLALCAQDPETADWMDRAALLDPAAYVYTAGKTWAPQVVPDGECWYLLNAFFLWADTAAPAGQQPYLNYWFLRTPDARNAMMLPQGTTLRPEPHGVQTAFAYYCRPALVTGQAAYANPKSLYYQRLARLKTLPLYDLMVTVRNTGAMGQKAVTAFPADFEAGMLVLASVEDASWLGLGGTDGTSGMNLVNELSDDHQARFTAVMLLPFKRSVFPQVVLRNSNVSGVYGDTATTIRGFCCVKYVKLPSDW